MPANQCIPLFRPGADLSVTASADVTGKTLVDINSGYSVPDGTLPAVKTCAAGAKSFGVAVYDQKAGKRLPIIVGPGHIVPITCGAAITAGAEVQSDAAGKAIVKAAGVAIGRAVTTTTAANTDVFVQLY